MNNNEFGRYEHQYGLQLVNRTASGVPRTHKRLIVRQCRPFQPMVEGLSDGASRATASGGGSIHFRYEVVEGDSS